MYLLNTSQCASGEMRCNMIKSKYMGQCACVNYPMDNVYYTTQTAV